jgi:hypothetical protein
MVYWGHHRGKENKDILKNRNKFVKEYGITNISGARYKDKSRIFDLLYYEQDDNKDSTLIALTDTSINYKNSIYFDDKKHTEYYLYEQLPHIIKKCDNDVKLKSVKHFRTDHNEYYTSKKYPRCIIHIFSMVTNDIEHNFIIESGYKEIYPMYAKDQRTYIMIRPRYKKDQNYFIEEF